MFFYKDFQQKSLDIIKIRNIIYYKRIPFVIMKDRHVFLFGVCYQNNGLFRDLNRSSKQKNMMFELGH